MTLDSRWYEADSRFIAGHYQPATLIDLALSRDIDSHRLLRGTGLFYEDIVAGHTRLSPQQCFALIANAQRLLEPMTAVFCLASACGRGITVRPAMPCNRRRTCIKPWKP